jgi:hypothetical protein
MTVYGLLALIPLVLVVWFLLKGRQPTNPETPAVYGGPIRFTHPDGRNMKIIQKDDGTFETVEE